ncbi:MAG: cofactor-independent phosphoglycerate mutase [Oscillospiraceae bacterium]|nr:cofactor-independent phosphoglycerate mutase [Oscillospiraceae bacterium]
MKHVIVLADGMGDYPVKELGGKTPMACAVKPNMDYVARKGVCGLVRTVPEGFPAQSDTANLAVMGYELEGNYTGRSPIEAVSMGIGLDGGDVCYRCNLVTLSDHRSYEDKLMLDYSSDEIETKEAEILIDILNEALARDGLRFHTGRSYRHCLVMRRAPTMEDLTPPHDILERPIGRYLPESADLRGLMLEGSAILAKVEEAAGRRMRGLNPANAIWLWGEGTKPTLRSFKSRFGLDGVMVSAVDLLKGLGMLTGMQVVEVEGATGNIHTNYAGKAEAAIGALKAGKDFAFIHVEAPDECGHRFEVENKVRSIELIDEHIVGAILERLPEEGMGEFKLMVMPDHFTPLSVRSHTYDPVPFAIYDSRRERDGLDRFDEESVGESGVYIDPGHTLMDYFINV